MSRSCAGLTSWYSSTIRWRGRRSPPRALSGLRSASTARDDLRAERHEPVAVEHAVVRARVTLRNSPSGSGSSGISSFSTTSRLSRKALMDPKSSVAVEPLELEPGCFAVEEVGELVGVQRRVGLVPRHVRLQQPEAVRVDRARRTAGRAGRWPAVPSFAVSPLRGSAPSARRRPCSVNVKATIASAGSPFCQERSDALRDDLGLARAGGGDDLDVPAAMGDGGGRLAFEHRDVRRCVTRLRCDPSLSGRRGQESGLHYDGRRRTRGER